VYQARLKDKGSFVSPGSTEAARDWREPSLKRDKLYGTTKNRPVMGIGNNETKLEHGPSTVIELQSRLERCRRRLM
jgi:hypothetical protein